MLDWPPFQHRRRYCYCLWPICTRTDWPMAPATCVLSSYTVLSNCTGHKKPRNPFHATSGICAKGCKEVPDDASLSHPPSSVALKRAWKKDSNAKILWAASSFFFWGGFLQSGDMVTQSEADFDRSSHLCFSDVKVDNRSAPSLIQVAIKASKTDPYWQGVTLHIGTSGGRWVQCRKLVWPCPPKLSIGYPVSAWGC